MNTNTKRNNKTKTKTKTKNKNTRNKKNTTNKKTQNMFGNNLSLVNRKERRMDVQELKIILKTNIPSNEEVVLDSSLLFLKDKHGSLNKYPFFTYSIEYPYNELSAKPYSEIVDFFFNKTKFNATLLDFIKRLNKETLFFVQQNYQIKDNVENQEKDNEEYRRSIAESLKIFNDKKTKIVKANMTSMLKLLFQTKFPIINNVSSSHDFLTNGKSLKDMMFSPLSAIFGTFPTYSYFKINGSVYTTKRVVWINDFLNHPVYRKLLIEYGDLYNDITNEINRLTLKKPSTSTDKPIITDRLSKLKELLKRKYPEILKPTNQQLMYRGPYGNNPYGYNPYGYGQGTNMQTRMSIEMMMQRDPVVRFMNDYKKYTDFYSMLRNNYLLPNRESSNAILQKLFTYDGDDILFNQFMIYLNNRYLRNIISYKASIPNVPELLFTGISTIKDKKTSMLEAYVMIDFVKGQMDDKNNFKCNFINEELGSILEQPRRIDGWDIFKDVRPLQSV